MAIDAPRTPLALHMITEPSNAPSMRANVSERRLFLCKSAFPLLAVRTQAGISPIEWVTCCLLVLLTFWLPFGARAEPIVPVVAAPLSGFVQGDPYASFVTDAARRFGIPEPRIRAVMHVESGDNAHAVSARGALGLMRIMPATWVALSARCDLGIDPFDPHDNVAAGTAYLREMLDRLAFWPPTTSVLDVTRSIWRRESLFPVRP